MAQERTTEKKPTTDKKPTKQEGKAPVHVLLRLKSASGETIAAHANMVARKGVAMLGKLGRAGLGDEFKAALNEQIKSGIRTYLFLTTKERWDTPYVTYWCLLKQVHSSLGSDKRTLVPGYYIHEAPNIKTWFEISSIDRLSQAESERIYVMSTGNSIASAIKGLNSVFRVGMTPKRK
jgi:hypothetical protein